jgi:CheY-like chemotaxis protein
MMKKERMIDIDTAYNGFEGYNKAINNIYDLVSCDINMPVMDGYQFCINFLKNFYDQNKLFVESI